MYVQLREQREHDYNLQHQGVFVRQAGGGEGGDGVREVRGRAVRVPHHALAHVRVHGQLHTQAEAPAREVHDEQRAGELHHTTGDDRREPLGLCTESYISRCMKQFLSSLLSLHLEIQLSSK